ncbi:PhzF family phenazine biosynthesis protein [Egbenema bharatensis]|uniref:PhzF family phenazine biosynthesis protein n=1 Tax=Egbenema bharatensis TaxID=3463334 RepID=UPI003A83FE48
MVTPRPIQPIVQVDAFTEEPFRGNPAAVCVLSEERSPEWMQGVAQEMNLSETAFLVKQPDGYGLRWFTPEAEVPLCGHATLASAHVLWTEGYLSTDQSAVFQTQSGVLIARQQDGWIELNFPVVQTNETIDPPPLADILGVPIQSPILNYATGYLVAVDSEAIVRQANPDFARLKQLPLKKAILTSAADSDSPYDFVSRFFAPGVGINEDPVTGSAHCALAPFWRDRLHKNEFLAYQASRRGGTLKLRYDGGDRVYLMGQAVTVMRGELVN